MKIVGLVQCKNEWGLIALSISHALLNHVDEVYVLNDASTDQTYHGLEHLKALWGNRLHIFNARDVGFRKEAAVNVLLQFCQRSKPDWVYNFDADEFLLTQNNISLREVLQRAGPEVKAIRYELVNYISLRDFDDANLNDYLRLRYKSIPVMQGNMDAARRAGMVYEGAATFFDMPFMTKLVFRAFPFMFISNGAHYVRNLRTGGHVKDAMTSDFRVAHLSMLTRKKLNTKIIIGETYARRGAPAWQGWQNQLIYKLHLENRLDEFWARHSIMEAGDSVAEDSPRYVLDAELVSNIGGAVAFLKSGFQSEDLSFFGKDQIPFGEAPETGVGFSDMIVLADKLKVTLDNTKASV